MSKTWLIIKREYTTRVRNKTFLLSTFLLPLVIVLFIAGSIYLSTKGASEKCIVALNDETGIFKNTLKDKKDKSIRFVYTSDTAVSKLLNGQFDAYIHIKDLQKNAENAISIEVKKQISANNEDYIRNQMNLVLENKMLEDNFKMPMATLDSMRKQAKNIDLIQSKGEGKDKQQIYSGLTASIGYFCGILIYITMFIYGTQVMRGVMEEKTNRIAEVIVSSVKPFQLMLGKIVGIGAVGITQFLLWIILIFGIFSVAQLFIPADILQQVEQLQNNPALQNSNTVQISQAAKNIAGATEALYSLNWPLIISSFLFFFLGGYLFYAALFAAVGSVINEDPQEAQSLVLPITMPIIFAFIILTQAIQNPNTSLAFWGSVIPFTSPIVMMGIVPAPGAVPWTQLVLSMTLLIAGFLFTTWLAAKIYHVGILSYGKKGSWKQMIKWAFGKS
ncbi:ABC transporter permease [Ferruginibacter sp. SUN002]|uniref:ABC transporter permease n=1 Tax=Ferruginibacter sp. SUN002 TaxID=2937789 RepID=UPI003D35B691